MITAGNKKYRARREVTGVTWQWTLLLVVFAKKNPQKKSKKPATNNDHDDVMFVEG